MSIRVGDVASDFVLRSQHYRNIRLSDFKGRFVVIYFYPKDNEPACTIESCTFRNHYAEFQALDTVILGVSSDSQGSHIHFSEKLNLPFSLLSDIGGRLRKQWCVPEVLQTRTSHSTSLTRMRFSANQPGRVTYVIDREGVVQHIFQSATKPQKHVEESLRIVRQLSQH